MKPLNMHRTEQLTRQFIARRSVMQPSERLLVALSGGADSVCLLLLMQELGFACMAAHCNFRLRGEESQRDEAFVRDLCRLQGVELHVTAFDTAEYAHQHHLSIELAARQLRYDYFAALMTEHDLSALAVGHHKEDQAETFLLNATRKTGLRGLCGMEPRQVNAQGCTVVRPLLELTRQDIEAYLKSRGQAWVTDSTNLQTDAARNRVRLNVVPELQRINAAAVANLNATMLNLTEVRRIYEAEMDRCIARCTRWQGNILLIDRQALMACTSPISVLHEVLAPLGFNETQVRNLLTARGYRSNRPAGARPFHLSGGKGTVLVEVTWRTISLEIQPPRNQ